MKRPFAWGLVALGALAALWAAARGARRPTYDNLVLVTVDTLRADHLGLYGYPRPTSPFLDSLGREGIVFWHAIAASSHTAPSHATLLTSLYPEQHRVLVNGQTLQPALTSLAEIAGSAGLETAAFASVGFLSGLSQGFEHFDAAVPEGQVFRSAELTVDRAVAWLGARDRKRRFALWIHLYDPHEHVSGIRMPEPHYAGMRADSAERGDELLFFLQQEHGYPRDRVIANIDRYDAQIAFVDEQLRRLFAALAATASGAHTLAVVTADHGEGLGNHGLLGHGQHLYNEQLRVPLILHGDHARLRHAVVRGLVRHVDVLPTVGELLGLGFDASGLRLEGRSLVPLLGDPSAELGIDAAFSQRRPADERRRESGWDAALKLAAQDARYKYILTDDGTDEFYDLSSDPYELRNLVTAPLPQKERLRRWLLEKYRALTQDSRTGETGAGEIDPAHVEALKALGYL